MLEFLDFMMRETIGQAILWVDKGHNLRNADSVTPRFCSVGNTVNIPPNAILDHNSKVNLASVMEKKTSPHIFNCRNCLF